MQKVIFVALFLLISNVLLAQINPANIQIARDSWGVPHIFAPKDEEVAYGLAWATAEDDFVSVQEQLLAAKGRLAEVKGREGARLDVIKGLIGIDELVDTAYTTQTFSPKFQKIIAAYTEGLNAYARRFPKEILLKGVFPITPKDLVKSYTLGFALFTGMPNELGKILNGKIRQDESQINFGSNTLAISKNRTTDGKTYLAINSHQPLTGPFSWYEVHLCSEEGWNILGGTLPGFTAIGHGVNEYLGWAHTVNQTDFTDVYKLEMNPTNPLQYKLDGKWETLQKRIIKIRVKVGLLKIGKKFTFYWSKYGATVQKDKDFYAIRFPANMHLQAPEQQYQMNKAKNWNEFQTALKSQKIPCFNIGYADREGNVFYISNGLIPYRNAEYDWRKVLPGNTSQTLWDTKYHLIEELPQVLNPTSGYIFNTNNTPFNSTAPTDNPKIENYDKTIGHVLSENNRSNRLQNLMRELDGRQISYEDFKGIKYDFTYPKPLIYNGSNLESIFSLDIAEYPALQEIYTILQNWNRKNDKDSEGAAVFMLIIHALRQNDKGNGTIQETELVNALAFAQNHLKKHFSTIHTSLGTLQRHQRGVIDLPMAGAPDAIAAMHSKMNKRGKFITDQGESYIVLVKFDAAGVAIETINAYGASAKASSPHYTDQMPLFVNQQLKPMTLDKAKVLREAKRIYHPE
jgi:acyl-homoserine-lactone acylase